jgi:aspartyl protease family protein
VLRYYLLFILAVGLGASLLSSPGPGSAPADSRREPPATLTVDAPAPAAELHQASGGGVALHRQADGHFYADVRINGSTVRMLVDTGASGIALTRDDARRAGIGISIGMPNVIGQGAGGEVKGEYVMLDRVSLGDESADSMPAVVLDGGGQSLLGQSFLGRFASVEIKGDTMVLR